MHTLRPFRSRGDYIGGEFCGHCEGCSHLVVRSPADLADRIAEVYYEPQHVDAAVAAAEAALPAWRATALADRCGELHRYRDHLKAEGDRLAELIVREVGKPIWEARSQVASMLAKVDVTLEEGASLIRDYARKDVAGRVVYRPHGVVVVVAGTASPAYVANAHLVSALAAGNTVILTTAPASPGVAQVLAECSGHLPAGVVNIVHGPAEGLESLVTHAGVQAVLFDAPPPLGDWLLKRAGQDPTRLVAAHIGGNNAAVVLEDADLNKALAEVLVGAFMTTGQRLSSTKRLIVHKAVAHTFLERLVKATRSLAIGYPFSEEVFAGSLRSEEALTGFAEMQTTAREEGAEELLAADRMHVDREGYYVRPSIHLVRERSGSSRYQHEVHPGPDLAVYICEGIDEAIEVADDTDYGLALAVFTRDRPRYERLVEACSVGVANWNRATVGNSRRFPFGGVRRSGNHRPAGITSTSYCCYPVACLEETAPLRRKDLTPGIDPSLFGL